VALANAGLGVGTADGAGAGPHAGRSTELAPGGTLSLRTAVLGVPVIAAAVRAVPAHRAAVGRAAGRTATTGLSNRMRMGSVAEVAQDDSVAMRIRFIDPPPQAQAHVFRGPVLSRFDGQGGALEILAFRAALGTAGQRPGLALRGDAWSRCTSACCPCLEATARFRPWRACAPCRRDDLVWNHRSAAAAAAAGFAATATRFQARAGGPRHQPQRTPACRRLQSAHAGLGGTLGADPATPLPTRTPWPQAVMNHIRTGGYTYTWRPTPTADPAARTAIDESGLDRKEGFCEHFASAFVVVMRALGIPRAWSPATKAPTLASTLLPRAPKPCPTPGAE